MCRKRCGFGRDARCASKKLDLHGKQIELIYVNWLGLAID